MTVDPRAVRDLETVLADAVKGQFPSVRRGLKIPSGLGALRHNDLAPLCGGPFIPSAYSEGINLTSPQAILYSQHGQD